MKTSAEKIEQSQVVLTVEVDPAMVDRSLDRAYRRLGSKANIPGFRKGKAPKAILERYLGKETLLEEAYEILIPEAYSQALKEHSIDAIGQPSIEITQREPFIFKAVVPVQPEVELGNYHQIHLDPPPAAVKEEDINAVIEQLRVQHSTWAPAERPAQLGDLLKVDIESSVEDKPYFNEADFQYPLSADLPIPAPGFSEKLVGMVTGEAREFTLGFPEDHRQQELKGKDAHFKVTVKEIKERQLPEITDEFAKELGEGLETVETLRQRVHDNLLMQAQAEAQAHLEDETIQAVVEMSRIEFPPILVEREVDHLIEDQMRPYAQSRMGLEDYLRAIRKTESELHEELHPVATRRIMRGLVLGKVFEAEQITVSPEEVAAEVELMAQGAGERQDEMRQLLSSPGAHYSIEQNILTRKTIARLVEIATAHQEGAVASTTSAEALETVAPAPLQTGDEERVAAEASASAEEVSAAEPIPSPRLEARRKGRKT